MRTQWLRLPFWHGCCVLLLVLLTCACGDPPKPEPPVYRAPQWQWQTNDSSPSLTVPIPTTNRSSGPTVRVRVKHEIGLGDLLMGDDLKSLAQVKASQTLSIEEAELKKAGWRPLFEPTEGGAFPDYVEYLTLKSDNHYCLVEYSVVFLNKTTASQQLDIYHA